MHLGNILGFGLLGLGMMFFPTLAPGLFPPEAGTGTNLSGLWLQFMGWVNGALGGLLWVRHALAPRLARTLAWRPAEIMRPVRALYRELEAGEQEGERNAA